jgi:hypothetical protein
MLHRLSWGRLWNIRRSPSAIRANTRSSICSFAERPRPGAKHASVLATWNYTDEDRHRVAEFDGAVAQFKEDVER